MEARDYIEALENLIQEYKDNNYLVSRYNTFEINPFTNDYISDIPVEPGYINIDSYYERAARDSHNRVIELANGDSVNAYDIILLSGDPASMTYYARYNGEVITPNIASYGSPVELNIAASKGSTYIDLVPYRYKQHGALIAEYHKYYVKSKQGDNTAWELITDKATVFQSNRLRYDIIDPNKYYWDISERVLYKLDKGASTRTPWIRYSHKLHGTNGDPTTLTYEYIKNNIDKYFFDYNKAETQLYKFNVDTMEWETFGSVVNYKQTENPDPISSIEIDGVLVASTPDSITLDNADKERYYYFIPDDSTGWDSGTLYRYDYTVYLKRIETTESFYESALEFYRELMHVYGDINPVDRIDHRLYILTNGYPAIKYPIPDMSRIYLDTKNQKIYRPTEKRFHECAAPYRVHTYTDIDSMDDIDPYSFVAGDYYFFPHLNKCYFIESIVMGDKEVRFDDVATTGVDEMGEMSVDDIDTPGIDEAEIYGLQKIIYEEIGDEYRVVYYRKTMLPNLPIEVDSLEELEEGTEYPLTYGSYYRVDNGAGNYTYYRYDPYEEIEQEHFYFNCGVFY